MAAGAAETETETVLWLGVMFLALVVTFALVYLLAAFPVDRAQEKRRADRLKADRRNTFIRSADGQQHTVHEGTLTTFVAGEADGGALVASSAGTATTTTLEGLAMYVASRKYAKEQQQPTQQDGHSMHSMHSIASYLGELSSLFFLLRMRNWNKQDIGGVLSLRQHLIITYINLVTIVSLCVILEATLRDQALRAPWVLALLAAVLAEIPMGAILYIVKKLRFTKDYRLQYTTTCHMERTALLGGGGDISSLAISELMVLEAKLEGLLEYAQVQLEELLYDELVREADAMEAGEEIPGATGSSSEAEALSTIREAAGSVTSPSSVRRGRQPSRATSISRRASAAPTREQVGRIARDMSRARTLSAARQSGIPRWKLWLPTWLGGATPPPTATAAAAAAAAAGVPHKQDLGPAGSCGGCSWCCTTSMADAEAAAAAPASNTIMTHGALDDIDNPVPLHVTTGAPTPTSPRAFGRRDSGAGSVGEQSACGKLAVCCSAYAWRCKAFFLRKVGASVRVHEHRRDQLEDLARLDRASDLNRDSWMEVQREQHEQTLKRQQQLELDNATGEILFSKGDEMDEILQQSTKAHTLENRFYTMLIAPVEERLLLVRQELHRRTREFEEEAQHQLERRLEAEDSAVGRFFIRREHELRTVRQLRSQKRHVIQAGLSLQLQYEIQWHKLVLDEVKDHNAYLTRKAYRLLMLPMLPIIVLPRYKATKRTSYCVVAAYLAILAAVAFGLALYVDASALFVAVGLAAAWYFLVVHPCAILFVLVGIPGCLACLTSTAAQSAEERALSGQVLSRDSGGNAQQPGAPNTASPATGGTGDARSSGQTMEERLSFPAGHSNSPNTPNADMLEEPRRKSAFWRKSTRNSDRATGSGSKRGDASATTTGMRSSAPAIGMVPMDGVSGGSSGDKSSNDATAPKIPKRVRVAPVVQTRQQSAAPTFASADVDAHVSGSNRRNRNIQSRPHTTGRAIVQQQFDGKEQPVDITRMDPADDSSLDDAIEAAKAAKSAKVSQAAQTAQAEQIERTAANAYAADAKRDGADDLGGDLVLWDQFPGVGGAQPEHCEPHGAGTDVDMCRPSSQWDVQIAVHQNPGYGHEITETTNQNTHMDHGAGESAKSAGTDARPARNQSSSGTAGWLSRIRRSHGQPGEGGAGANAVERRASADGTDGGRPTHVPSYNGAGAQPGDRTTTTTSPAADGSKGRRSSKHGQQRKHKPLRPISQDKGSSSTAVGTGVGLQGIMQFSLPGTPRDDVVDDDADDERDSLDDPELHRILGALEGTAVDDTGRAGTATDSRTSGTSRPSTAVSAMRTSRRVSHAELARELNAQVVVEEEQQQQAENDGTDPSVPGMRSRCGSIESPFMYVSNRSAVLAARDQMRTQDRKGRRGSGDEESSSSGEDREDDEASAARGRRTLTARDRIRRMSINKKGQRRRSMDSPRQHPSDGEGEGHATERPTFSAPGARKSSRRTLHIPKLSMDSNMARDLVHRAHDGHGPGNETGPRSALGAPGSATARATRNAHTRRASWTPAGSLILPHPTDHTSPTFATEALEEPQPTTPSGQHQINAGTPGSVASAATAGSGSRSQRSSPRSTAMLFNPPIDTAVS